jgi:hypothetical protein
MHKSFGKGRKAGRLVSSALLAILLFVPFLFFTACPTENSAKAGNEITGVSLLDNSVNEVDPVKFDGVHKVIDKEKGEVEITVIARDVATLDALRLQVEVSEGAVTNPTNETLKNDKIDYYNSLPIVVTAENGTTKLWTVIVKKYYEPKNDITDIVLLDKTGTPVTIVALDIDPEKGEAVVTVPRGTPIDENLYLEYDEDYFSPNATTDLEEPAEAEEGAENPPPPNPLDPSGKKTITVTAEDGTAKTWTVSVKQDPSPVQNLSVELLGNYDIRFLFAYPNYKIVDDNTRPGIFVEENPPYPLTYPLYNADGSYDPILLSYFVDDNDIKAGDQAITYYNTLIVSAGGFKTLKWKIDGVDAPDHEGNDDDTILTIHAQDWTLEDLHTVTLIGTKTDAKGNEQKYSGEFTFRVVEKAPFPVTE